MFPSHSLFQPDASQTSSGVVLSAEHVVDIAKEVIHSVPLACNWQQCHAELNSWNALQEHLHRHCDELKPSNSQPGILECKLPKCSARFHATLHELQQHIDLSHLSRVLLPCPIQDCEVTFGRNANALPEHLQTVHRHMLDRRIPRGSSVLRPLKQPHPHTPQRLSPLPDKPVPAYVLMSPAVRIRPAKRGQTPGSSQGGGRRKWKRMHAVQIAPSPASDDEDCIPLPDLPPFDPRHLPDILECRKPLEPMLQQARPQPMNIPPVLEHPPPVSIGYTAFAARFKVLEKAGVIDGTGRWPRRKSEEADSQDATMVKPLARGGKPAS
ncbi:hypothetical protein BD413DRAFT_568754 [Trametes elegans]|nr:hypothetical protein BD413DRAFT_568754 [Trametes elegans]